MATSGAPNILLIVSDEERRNDWLPSDVVLPAHDRLRSEGLEFTRHYTHTSPCSPSRASLYSGRYLPAHGVVDNVNFDTHQPLDPSIPTVGRLLRERSGYEAAYLGKWHLWPDAEPRLDRWGYSGWHGNDRHFMGGAYTGAHFDPVIARQAVEWLTTNASSSQPWFLTVALVNPHDIMWFPADQPWYQREHPEDAEMLRRIMHFQLGDLELAPIVDDYPERFEHLPESFDDDLHTKPEIQRIWRYVRNREHFVGFMPREQQHLWLRQLDYYASLHERLDESVATILAAMDGLGLADDTVVIYTSDHGDACGAHGLRAKLPCVYEEVMGVPLIVRVPGSTDAGTTTNALSTHVDLAATICALGGIEIDEEPSLQGVDLAPVLAGSAAAAREHVLFAQDSAQSELIRGCRYALRGFFDGTTKYARYYGVGGGTERDGTASGSTKVFGVDADFDDVEHEWYELDSDPDELVNLAHDRGRRRELREIHARLLDFESRELTAPALPS